MRVTLGFCLGLVVFGCHKQKKFESVTPLATLPEALFGFCNSVDEWVTPRPDFDHLAARDAEGRVISIAESAIQFDWEKNTIIVYPLRPTSQLVLEAETILRKIEAGGGDDIYFLYSKNLLVDSQPIKQFLLAKKEKAPLVGNVAIERQDTAVKRFGAWGLPLSADLVIIIVPPGVGGVKSFSDREALAHLERILG